VGTLPLLLKINTIALWIFILGSLILCVKNNDWRVNLKSKKRILWILFALLSLYFIGLFSSKDFSAIIKQIIKTLPLLIVPLFVLSHNKGDFNLKNIYISLGIGLFVGMLICWYNILISIMSKEKYTEQAKYFFEWIYTDWNLVAPLNGHPSYFAILIVLFLCALIMNENFKKLRRNRLKLALIIFPYFLFLIETSSRIGVISLIIILLFYSIKKFNYKRLLGMIVLLSIVILFSIKFDYLGSKFTKVVSMDGEIKIERYHRWKEIIKVFKAENNWLLGVGPSDAHKIYKSAYDNGNFDLAFNNNYNAHNQYLEFFISNGIVGF
jgi:O-antigen ligase